MGWSEILYVHFMLLAFKFIPNLHFIYLNNDNKHAYVH